jgi:hypothetical protein
MAPTLEKNTGHSGSFPDPAEFPDVTDEGANPAAATLGRVAPPPKRVVPLPDIATDPAEAALQLLVGKYPNSIAEAKTRIERLNWEIDGDHDEAEVERARLDRGVALQTFARAVAVKVNARSVLQARLARLDPTFTAPPIRLADEVCRYIRKIQRWSSGNALRTELASLIGRLENNPHDDLRPGLAQIEQAWMDLSRDVHAAAKEHRSTLLDEPSDELLCRAEANQAKRQALAAQLDDLGRPADRAALVVAAIEEAGREAVCKCIEPTRYVYDESAELVKRKRNLEAQIPDDTDTNRYRTVTKDLDLLEQQIQSVTASAAETRRKKALELIAEAQAGDLGSIAEIETLVFATIPALAQKLNQARGSDSQLVRVVAALLEPPPPIPCSMCQK